MTGFSLLVLSEPGLKPTIVLADNRGRTTRKRRTRRRALKNAAYMPETQTKRTEDFYELVNDLLDESERALEENDLEWCAMVHRLLIPVAAREVRLSGASDEASPAAA